MNTLQDPAMHLIALAAIVFAGAAIAISVSHIRFAWKHIGMKRIAYIKTEAKPETSQPAPLTFPNHPVNFDVINDIVNSHKPEPVGDLDLWSIANWQRLPASVRKQCVDHLHDVLSKAIDWSELSAKWKQQKADGIRIGSDQYCFHFGSGRFVRNVLREVLADERLPEVIDNGHPMRHWDSHYYGAIDELAGRL